MDWEDYYAQEEEKEMGRAMEQGYQSFPALTPCAEDADKFRRYLAQERTKRHPNQSTIEMLEADLALAESCL